MVSHPLFPYEDNEGRIPIDRSKMMGSVFAVAPKLSVFDSQMVFREKYDTTFGIYNHDDGDPERELAAVEMHWPESTLIGSKLYERMKEYDEAGIYEYFKLTLTDFLAQSPHVVDFQIKYAVKKKTAEAERMQAATNKLQADIDGKTKR